MNHLRVNQTKETELFFRQWLRSPKSMGAVIPSSRVLARAVTEAVHWEPGQHVVELGAGTGSHTGAVLSRLSGDARFLSFEIDPRLAAAVRKHGIIPFANEKGVMLSPPLTVSRDEADQIAEAVEKSIVEVFG